jgi:hypothetical protein
MADPKIPPPPPGFRITGSPPPPPGFQIVKESNEPKPASWFDEALQFGAGAAKGLVVNTLGNIYEMGKRIVTPAEDTRGKVSQMVMGPAGALVSDMVVAQGDQFAQAYDLAKKGQYLDASGRLVAGLLPGIGPPIAAAAEKLGTAAGSGDTFGAGEAVGDLAGLAAMPEVAKAMPSRFLPRPANAVTQAAVDFGIRRGIPLDAATQTGSKTVQVLQKVVDSTPIGSMLAERAKNRQAEAFGRVGGELLNEISISPAVAEQAGSGVQSALRNEIALRNAEAGSAYDTLRQIEADPANVVQVQTGMARSPQAMADLDAFAMSQASKPFAKLTPAEQSAVISLAKSAGVQVAETPVIESISLPVDLRNPKATLKPIYDSLLRQMPVAQVRASTGMKSLANIMEAPDYLPLSIADADLSAIKAAARGADLPELKTLSQGLAAKAVAELEDAVQQATAQGGPQALAARDAGRAATVAKYDAASVLKQLREEPVQTFRQLTWGEDAGIDRLRDVEKLAPNEMRFVGRAYVKDILDKGTAEGGLTRQDAMFRDWAALGPETKKILYKNPGLIEDLDNFFTLAKKSSENPNPSGSGLFVTSSGSIAYAFTNPTTGIPMLIGAGALSELLHSPKAVAALSRGLDPKFSQGAGAIAAAANISKVAKDYATPMDQKDNNKP